MSICMKADRLFINCLTFLFDVCKSPFKTKCMIDRLTLQINSFLNV